jgi:hypothetical protein
MYAHCKGATNGRPPHLAKNERDTPNFLHAALARGACAPFYKERRMKSAEPNKLYRKSGVWGTRVRGRSIAGRTTLGTWSVLHVDGRAVLTSSFGDGDPNTEKVRAKVFELCIKGVGQGL